MRKVYIVLVALFIQFLATAQTDITIGSATTGNTGTSYPSALQDYYEGSRMQFLYLSSEMTAAGMTPGNISAIRYNVTNLNTFSGTIEQMAVSIGSTGTSSLTLTSWEAGTTQVYGPIDYVPISGTNNITFTTPFFWNGSDNIVIEICNGDPNNPNAITYTQNVTTPVTTGLSFNGSHNYRADNLMNLCGSATTTNSGLQTSRPDITFEWTAVTTGCFLPSGTTIANITAYAADVSWTPATVGSPAAGGYNYEVRTSGAAGSGSTGLVSSGTVTGTNVSLSALTPATNYSFYIQSNCGAGSTSTWSGAYNFTTSCAPITAFNENFDGVIAPALPLCWASILRGSTVGTASITTTNTAANVFSSPNAVSMYNSAAGATDDIILTSPPLSNLSIGTYQLSFYAKNSTAGQDVEVGTMDDNSSTGTFTALQTVTLSTTYQKYIVDFSTYTGTDTYIAIRRLNTTTFTYVYLDNINWEMIPSCVEPNTLLISAITTTDAQLDWTAPSSGSPASYDVYASASNTPPTATTTPTISAIANTTAILTGLIPSTQYFVWVRSNCGTGGSSIWLGADSFYTQCIATNIPYTQNFELATVPGMPPCTATENVGTGNNWVTINNPGYGFTTKTLEYVYNLTNPADVWFYTQGLNLTAGTSYRLAFKYGNNSTTYVESMNVSYGSSASATDMTNPIVDYPSITGSILTNSATDFTPATTGVYYIGFHAYSISNQFDLYVDDISVDLAPLCSEPTALTISNITTADAQLDWTAPSSGSPVSYDIYYSTSNVSPTSSTTPNIPGVTGTTATLTGLSASATYFVWVRSNCGTGGYSTWSVADSFVTPCVAVTDFSENFDGITPPAFPVCWAKVGAGGTASTQAGYQQSGANSLLLYGTSATSQAVVSMPAVSNIDSNNHQLKFSIKSRFTAGAIVEVGYLTDPIDPATFTAFQSFTTTLAYQTFTVIPTGVTGSSVVLAFRHVGAPANSTAIDDVMWEAVPGCVEPSNLVVSNVTISYAQVDWTAPTVGTPASYDVYFSTSNTPPTGTTTPNITGVTNTTANLTGLSASSIYYVWVRSNCGSNGYSVWSALATFVTPCGTATVPTASSENFSGTTFPPNCWSRFTGALESPSVLTTTTGGWTTDDYGNVTTPLNQSAKLNIYGDNRRYWLMTPAYDLGAAGGNYQLEFDLAFTKWNLTDSSGLGGDDSLAVVISTDGGVTWNSSNILQLWDTTSALHPLGEHVIINLATYTGTVMFGFYGASTVTGNGDNDVFVDNLQITQVLPVSLLNFTGEKKGISNLLTWSTASEQNSKGFELQRSAGGDQFTTIAFVKSKAENGNSTAQLNYSFADEKPFAGNSYYRLKQMDKDGKTTLSNIVLIKGTKPNSIVLSSVYPSPTSNKLNVVMSAPANEKVTLVVTDMTGKIMQQQTAQLINGDNNLVLNVTALSSGTYLVKAVCSNGCETAISKFMKK